VHPVSLEEIAALVVLDIAVIVIVARLMGRLCTRIGQPAVVGEILAGVALGPSLLGTLPGDPTSFLFPPEVRPYLTVVAGLGLVIYMFVVGLELNLDLIRGKGRLAATVSLTSVALPFTLGLGLALWLHDAHGTSALGGRIDLLPFALFIGASMSVTAFPVLARILAEQRLNRTQTGALALACAAVDDVLAWIILALVLAVIRSSGGVDLLLMAAESVAFVVVVFLVLAPRLRRLVRIREESGRLTPDAFAVVLVGTLLCAFITEEIGIHAIFGAFVFGAAMPRRGAEQLTQEILERVEPVTVLLLLPVFFITTGLKVDITALGRTGLVELGAVLLVACTGKFVGAAVAARVSGVHTRRAAALGILMNTRGLTELVILNVGYEAGVLDRDLFTVLVMMALVTTLATAPLLRLIYSPARVNREIAHAERQALGLTATYRAVVAVDETTSTGAVTAAEWMTGGETSAQLVLLRLDEQPPTLGLGAGLGANLELVAVTHEALDALAAGPRENGVGVVTRSQFSRDVTEDALRMAEAAEADVLVWARGGDHLPAELTSRAESPVVWVRVPPDGLNVATLSAVVAEPGRSDDGLAAVEVAARIATASGLPLVLADGDARRDRKRAQGLVPRLRAWGIDVDTQAGAGAGSAGTVTVVGWSEWERAAPAETEGLVLVVRGAPDDHGQRLDALLSNAQAR
jgi:Kef-type K+ transport system membrane component KefB